MARKAARRHPLIKSEGWLFYIFTWFVTKKLTLLALEHVGLPVVVLATQSCGSKRNKILHRFEMFSEYCFKQPYTEWTRISQTGPRPPLGAAKRLCGSHEQRSLLDNFAETFTSIAKPKCHVIEYSPIKLKFVVFIITS